MAKVTKSKARGVAGGARKRPAAPSPDETPSTRRDTERKRRTTRRRAGEGGPPAEPKKGGLDEKIRAALRTHRRKEPEVVGWTPFAKNGGELIVTAVREGGTVLVGSRNVPQLRLRPVESCPQDAALVPPERRLLFTTVRRQMHDLRLLLAIGRTVILESRGYAVMADRNPGTSYPMTDAYLAEIAREKIDAAVREAVEKERERSDRRESKLFDQALEFGERAKWPPNVMAALTEWGNKRAAERMANAACEPTLTNPPTDRAH